MGRLTTLLLALIFLLSSGVVYNASAQSFLPDIEIDCEVDSYSGMIQIYVFPGATNSGYVVCTLYNPTPYSEDVEVTIESGILLAIGPGTVTVGPGVEEQFVVSLIAEPEIMMQTIPVEIKAVVVAVTGQDVGALPEGSDTEEEVALIMEYSDPTIQLAEAEIDMVSGEDYDVGVIYGNNGNGNSDTMRIGVVNVNRDTLEDAGFTILARANAIEIDSGDSTIIEFDIRAPKGITKEKYFIIEFYVESEFSCNYEGWCNRQSAFATILVTEAEPEGAFAPLGENSTIIFSGIGGGIVVMAVAVVILKRKKVQSFAQEEEHEEFEDDVEDLDDEIEEDDFEDDLDDDFFDDL